MPLHILRHVEAVQLNTQGAIQLPRHFGFSDARRSENRMTQLALGFAQAAPRHLIAAVSALIALSVRTLLLQIAVQRL
jgi:hypothetical protein